MGCDGTHEDGAHGGDRGGGRRERWGSRRRGRWACGFPRHAHRGQPREFVKHRLREPRNEAFGEVVPEASVGALAVFGERAEGTQVGFQRAPRQLDGAMDGRRASRSISPKPRGRPSQALGALPGSSLNRPVPLGTVVGCRRERGGHVGGPSAKGALLQGIARVDDALCEEFLNGGPARRGEGVTVAEASAQRELGRNAMGSEYDVSSTDASPWVIWATTWGRSSGFKRSILLMRIHTGTRRPSIPGEHPALRLFEWMRRIEKPNGDMGFVEGLSRRREVIRVGRVESGGVEDPTRFRRSMGRKDVDAGDLGVTLGKPLERGLESPWGTTRSRGCLQPQSARRDPAPMRPSGASRSLAARPFGDVHPEKRVEGALPRVELAYDRDPQGRSRSTTRASMADKRSSRLRARALLESSARTRAQSAGGVVDWEAT